MDKKGETRLLDFFVPDSRFLHCAYICDVVHSGDEASSSTFRHEGFDCLTNLRPVGFTGKRYGNASKWSDWKLKLGLSDGSIPSRTTKI